MIVLALLVAPWFTLKVVGDAESVKLGAGFTVTEAWPLTPPYVAVTVPVAAVVAVNRPPVVTVPIPLEVQTKGEG